MIKCVVAVLALSVLQFSPSAAIVRDLQSRDWITKGRAVAFEARASSPELDTPAIQVLAGELRAITEQLILRESDSPSRPPYPADFDVVSYWRSLGEILAREQNPIAIDALAGAISSGGAPFAAIVRFGEPAVPPVVASVRSEHGLLGHIDRGLDALEQMLEQPAIAQTLSPASLDLIKVVAGERMATPGPKGAGSVLASAAYLAIATHDPRLRATAASLIDNPTAIQSRGVAGPQYVAFISTRLRQALEKFPPP